MAAKWTIPPLWYYTFEFFDDERRAHAGDYLQRVQVKPFLYRWLIDRKRRRDKTFPFASKLYFAEACRRHRIEARIEASTPIATVTSTGFTFYEAGMTELPPRDLFVKIRTGRGGRGAEKWSYAAGTFRNAKGRSLTGAELVVHLTRRSTFEKRIVENCLINHSALADLNLGALATARIMTARNETGDIEATHAVFRMPQRPGAPVDNIHAGGIAAPVDLATGRLGRATDLGLKTDSRWHERHPTTGAVILGRTLPHWPAALALTRRAHALIGDRVVVGWGRRHPRRRALPGRGQRQAGCRSHSAAPPQRPRRIPAGRDYGLPFEEFHGGRYPQRPARRGARRRLAAKGLPPRFAA